ncbi:MAG TPA: hypothetical protein VE954_25555 [Oligoflexus sp.]|uniref:hypothetical protein n=1 Tax=Oligoflexus sp. TaxID=1971216 RepID=UPI002D246D58|nr:hypothetical protein [Oligoflexus sp.]HYX36488.1 hypothetical protein [Oligoflexus sp.]
MKAIMFVFFATLSTSVYAKTINCFFTYSTYANPQLGINSFQSPAEPSVSINFDDDLFKVVDFAFEESPIRLRFMATRLFDNNEPAGVLFRLSQPGAGKIAEAYILSNEKVPVNLRGYIHGDSVIYALEAFCE